MRSSKSTLAGVAAGALALALVPFVGTTAANAAALTGSVSPVRVTYVGSTQDVVPYATAAWTGAAADDTAVLTLTSAPSGAAQVLLSAAQRSGVGPTNYTNAAQLGVEGTAVTLGAGSGDDSVAYIAADTAGAYVGTITTYNAGAASNTVAVSFTSTGAAASLAVTVDTPSAPKATNVAPLATLSVKDAAGSATQLTAVDTITLSTTETGGVWDDTVLDAYNISEGSAEADRTTGSTAGSFTMTATPGGTPWGSAATGAYEVIDNVLARSISMTDSSTQANTTDAVPGAPGGGIVRPTSTTVIFDLTVGDTEAGNPVVVTVSGTALSASSTQVVTTNSSGEGTLSVTVPASGAIVGNYVEVTDGGTTYRATYTAGAVYYSMVERAPSAGTIALQAGTSKDIALTVDDSYGVGQAGYIVIASTTSVSGVTPVSGTTDANGAVTLSLPDVSTSSTTSIAWTFRVNEPGTSSQIGGSATGLNLTLAYSATGDVTLSDLKYNTVDAADYAITPAVPYAGVVEVAAGTGTDDSYTLTAVAVTVDVANTEVTFSGGDECSGVWFTESNSRISDLGAAVAAGTLVECSITVVASGTTATAYVTSTATGSVEVDAFSTSGNELSGSITFVNDAAAARNVAVSAQPAKVEANRTSAVTVAVTDVFGNPVQLTGSGAAVSLVTDFGTFGNGSNIFTVSTTTPGGSATVSVTAPEAGIATISATGTGGQFGADADSPYTGAPASVSQAAVPVEFTSGPTDKSIVIEGSRTTVKGKPGIMIDGNTTGIEDGKTVVPYFRFPGQSAYTQGSARPEVNDDEFTWQRKTGKKFYAYVTNDDGTVKSNRVIIPAK